MQNIEIRYSIGCKVPPAQLLTVGHMPEIFERSYTMNIQEKMEKYLGKTVSQAEMRKFITLF